ncbi:hypothetical protein, partial [Xanthomonas citri]
ASYNNVGAALTALDSKVSELDARGGAAPAASRASVARLATARTAGVDATADGLQSAALATDATADSALSSAATATAIGLSASTAVQGTPTAAMDGSITPAATS